MIKIWFTAKKKKLIHSKTEQKVESSHIPSILTHSKSPSQYLHQMNTFITSSDLTVSLKVHQFSSVQSLMSYSLQPHGLQHTSPPCPSPTPRVCSKSYPLSRWCHPTISSSFIPFSSHLQSFPASGSFQMSQFFVSGGQSIGVSASTSVLPMNIQDWFPLGWSGWISLQSTGLSKSIGNRFHSMFHPNAKISCLVLVFFISLGLSIVSSISKSSFDTKAHKQELSFSLFTPFKILLF